jgi:hypothetical protein
MNKRKLLETALVVQIEANKLLSIKIGLLKKLLDQKQEDIDRLQRQHSTIGNN